MKVRLSLSCCLPHSSTPIAEIPANREYDLVLTGHDLRPEGSYIPEEGMNAGQTVDLVRGLFAVYCDVLFPQTCTQVKSAVKFIDSFQFNSPFTNGKSAVKAYSGIRWLGCFAGLGLGSPNPAEILRARMVSKRRGTVKFDLTVANMASPVYDTLVYGNLAATPLESSFVDKSEIECIDYTLQIT